ncbi:diguanylate cyclase [Jannaschia sp. W003]|uniref:diguanylate cyclase n=1 Tax=Jannaschia sp. W003 TaxID=2867012 RepID=UPI0021A473C5|nr:diguanylate cyclase [Jannaschia sp. W003]UWQ21161.1 diguanylate cyclase [Jannaschia sp. W003]
MSGRILIVDDVATNRIVMKVKLAAARYDVVLASDGEEALRIARAGGVDVIIMDVLMPGVSGAEVCRRLRADPATAAVPVILITAVNDEASRLDGLEAGADEFLARPVDEVALLARVRSLLRSQEEEREFGERGGPWLGAEFGFDPPAPLAMGGTAGGGLAEAPEAFAHPCEDKVLAIRRTPGRIAVLCHDTDEAGDLVDALAPGFDGAPLAMDRDGALALHGDAVPDVFVVDADLGGRGEGLRLMSELRSRHATRRAACVIVLPCCDTERAATALDLGAADVAHRPVVPAELSMRLRTQIARKRRADRMRASLEEGLRMAVIDPLTGLYNRRYGLHHLDRVATRCRGPEGSAGVILLDIDHFKAVNDTYGHPRGDEVLAAVAGALREQLRAEDLLCRIGGEEFLAVLPDVSLEQAHGVAERLRRAVASTSVRLGDGRRLAVTVSLGVTTVSGPGPAPERALERVDRALYAAKAEGRDRISVALAGG